YDVQRTLGCADPQAVLQALVSNPTPGAANPASPGGTLNDARVIPFISNPVISYLTTDLNTGAPLVVNITGADSQFSPGYVARQVKRGAAKPNGKALKRWQSPAITAQWLQDLFNEGVWGGQMSQIIKNAKSKCGCQQ